MFRSRRRRSQAAATGGVATHAADDVRLPADRREPSMTPKVTYQDEIILDPIVVDKSGLGQNILVAAQLLPTFVNRTASIAMRLRDGESNLLAGLIREEDREIANSLPGINRRFRFCVRSSATTSSDDRLQRHHHDRHAAHHSLARDHGGGPQAALRRHATRIWAPARRRA